MYYDREDQGCDLSVNQLEGSVCKDPRYAGMLMSAFSEQLFLVSTHTYRSLLVSDFSPPTAEVLERIAVEESGHFRMLRDLIQALGGNPMIYTSRNYEGVNDKIYREDLPSIVALSRQEVEHSIDHCETLMGKTKDRVVRSLLSGMLMEKQHQLDRLRKIG